MASATAAGVGAAATASQGRPAAVIAAAVLGPVPNPQQCNYLVVITHVLLLVFVSSADEMY